MTYFQHFFQLKKKTKSRTKIKNSNQIFPIDSELKITNQLQHPSSFPFKRISVFSLDEYHWKLRLRTQQLTTPPNTSYRMIPFVLNRWRGRQQTYCMCICVCTVCVHLSVCFFIFFPIECIHSSERNGKHIGWALSYCQMCMHYFTSRFLYIDKTSKEKGKLSSFRAIIHTSTGRWIQPSTIIHT